MSRHIRLPISRLSSDQPVAVELAPDGRRRRQAIVCQTESGIRAYLNECQHLPVPLDGFSGQFLAEDGQHLLCRTHGAEYRLSDGYCVAGPCKGESLRALRAHHQIDVVIIEDADPG